MSTAAAADVNPNLVAYAHSLGYQVTDLTMGPPVNARYMAWISAQAKAYETVTGETLRGEGWYDRFTAWLTARYPEPVIAGCTSCDLTVPVAEIYESGTHGEPGWFCDGCSYPTPRRHRKATAGTKAP